MIINLKDLNIPRRPKKYNGIDIKSVKFGMAWHSVHWAEENTLREYVEKYWLREDRLQEYWKLTEGRVNSYFRKVEWHRMINEDEELQKWSKILTNCRKDIRRAKWLAMSNELLVVINDSPWQWPIDAGGGWDRASYISRPNKGDLLMCIDENDLYRSKNARIYSVIQNRSDYNLKVILPETHSIVDTVLPLSFYT